MKKQLRGSLILMLVAIIWGIAFVAQSEGLNYVGPLTIQATRFFLAGLVLLPVIALRDRTNHSDNRPVTKAAQKKLAICGLSCGILLCAASTVQQFGLMYTTVGKSGFITALYIVIVPIIGMFIGRKVSPMVWISVVLAVVGLYFLCLSGSMTIQLGDLLTLICALLFSLHILFVDHFCGNVDPVRLSCIQFFTCSIICAVGMFVLEKPVLSDILECWLPICYAGLLSGGVAYTLQIVGQRDTDPTIASLIMSLESVFATLAGWILLRQALTRRELLGCSLMFLAILLSQLPPELFRKKLRI